LDAAAEAGLLTQLGGGMYLLHPALPAYLAAQWRTGEGAGYDDQRAAATLALLSAYATFGRWLLQQINSGDAGLAYTIIGWQQRTMGHLLGYALDSRCWAEAQGIAQPLSSYWRGRGLHAEAAGWTDRVRLATEDADGTPPGLDSAPGQLWIFFTGEQAQRQIDSGRLDAAEQTYREILAMLQAKSASPQPRYIATTYHQLGMVAEDRRRLGEAADWYARSLAIEEELGNRPGMAATYVQLGNVAYRQEKLDEAAGWYARSLGIKEELGDRPGMALSYHGLGLVAGKRGRLDEAAGWYARSLAIKEELGDRPEMALSYGQLGLLAEAQGNPGQAMEWIVRCVALFDDFPHPSTEPAPGHLARLTLQLGIPALEACWQKATGSPLPDAVRDYVHSRHTDTQDTSEGAGP
jgi:tetratricopeptide (TPR) repeat protein